MISVPSSSGKSLQLFLLAGKNEKMSNFSPLFIGEITSTVGKFQLKLTNAATFQSPLHRGNHFNSRKVPAEAHQRSHISVPSSSEKSLQPATFVARGAAPQFQSPLHRGNHFNLP